MDSKWTVSQTAQKPPQATATQSICPCSGINCNRLMPTPSALAPTSCRSWSQTRLMNPLVPSRAPRTLAVKMILMGDAGVSVNLGDCLPYLEQRFREMIGKDPASLEAAVWFGNLQKTAMVQATNVYCVGMHRPLPFESIYQPTRLRVEGSGAGSETESFYHEDQ